MEKNAKIERTAELFARLVRRTMDGGFRFPGGAAARRAVEGCLVALERRCAGGISGERIADFCICQAYAISRYGGEYLARRWKVSHSFGGKALERFAAATARTRYWEDRWLQKAGLARESLALSLRDRREHPLWPYVDPACEETTKRRVAGTPVDYYVCGVSTLMWNPFSESCRSCRHAERCRTRTARRYPELYRLRCEEAERRLRR